MKNLFKFGFLALAISLSVAACSSKKTEKSAADSIDTTADVTTDTLTTVTDTIDSATEVKVDSVKN